ncbi:hypothetical protein G9F72_011920 [Clostridium estertheticum]|uniref:MATE family efflux transporter n=1 Tax=Clostridium estertheticum TaxID=238834 RepID=UPI001CD16350|nr:MATE family efflux transporter [Clostridium estertheticum]MBZ9687031.1 hypothetical protein [Clostridium estertheticum]
MFLFQGPIIATLFGSAEPEVISNAHTYLCITLLTYPLITIDLVANRLLRGAGDTKTPMKISIFMNSVATMLNVPGNSLSIAATALVGKYMGRGEAKEAQNSLSYITALSTIFKL